MVIAIIILSWLLVNTWLTLAMLGKNDLTLNDAWGWVVTILCSVFNVFVVLGVFLLCEKIHKAYRRRRGVVRVPLWKKIVHKFKKR